MDELHLCAIIIRKFRSRESPYALHIDEAQCPMPRALVRFFLYVRVDERCVADIVLAVTAEW